MKTIFYTILFLTSSFSQDDSFYVGLGIVKAKLKAKTEAFKRYKKAFTQNPYFFVGYDITAQEYGRFRFAVHFGLNYLSLENKYEKQKDKYNLVILNIAPKLDLSISNDIALQVKLHSDIKFIEFFTNIDGSSEVRNSQAYLEGFNTLQLGYEVGVQFKPEWLNQYKLEISYISYFTPFFEDKTFEVEAKPTFQLTIYTML
jgi:hypothetical protein